MPPTKTPKASPSNALISRREDNSSNNLEVPDNKRGGTLLHSRYLRFLEGTDDYSDLSFSPSEAQFIRRKMSHLSTGSSAAIPLVCPGADSCPFVQKCPFATLGKEPTGRECLVEVNLLKEWTISFIHEYDVHPESMTDRILVQELAEIELSLYRINSNLSKIRYGEFIAESVANVTQRGDIIFEEKVVPLMDLKLRLQTRRDKVISSLVGDRRSKTWEAGVLKKATGDDISSKGADLRSQLEKLQRNVSNFAAKMMAKEGTVITIEEEQEKKNHIIETTAESVVEHHEELEEERQLREEEEDRIEREEIESQYTPIDYMNDLIDGKEGD